MIAFCIFGVPRVLNEKDMLLISTDQHYQEKRKVKKLYSSLDVIFGNLGTSSECTDDCSLRLTAKIDHCLLRYIEMHFSELDTVPHTVDFIIYLLIYLFIVSLFWIV